MQAQPSARPVVKLPLETERRNFSGTPSDFDSEVLGKKSWGPKLDAELADYESRREHTSTTETEELLCQLKESGQERAKQYKLPEQKFFEDEAPRIGRKMSHTEFITILRKKLKCWYNPVPFRGIVGLRAFQPGHEQKGLQFVCGVKLGPTTEYDTFHYDRRGLATNKKTIGWRTVLLQLIAKGFLTEPEAHRLFGKPALNFGSELYRQRLQAIRKDKGIF